MLQVIQPAIVLGLEALPLQDNPLEVEPLDSLLANGVGVVLQELPLAPLGPDLTNRVLVVYTGYRAANTGPVDGAAGAASPNTPWAIEFPNTSL